MTWLRRWRLLTVLVAVLALWPARPQGQGVGTSPLVQFLNAAGTTGCAGCFLYSFVAGSSTPLSTWSEPTLMVANTNPLELDVAGRGVVYLSQASYKFELRSAAGVTIWTQDVVVSLSQLVATANTPVVQTSSVTGTQNNFALTANVSTLVMSNAALTTFTGFTAGTAGQRVTVISTGAGRVEYAHQSGSSLAAARFYNIATSAATPTWTGGFATFVYDGASAVWRLTAHEQGEWITPTFAAGDYTAASGTWTVASGDVLISRYRLSGRTLSFATRLLTTDVSATPATLNQAIPGGFTTASGSVGLSRVTNAGGTAVVSIFVAQSAQIQHYATPAAGAWSIAAANTWIEYSFTMEVL